MVSQTKSQGPSLSTNDMPSGKRADEMNGVASPTDSDNAEKQLAELESEVSSKLEIDTDEVAKDPLLTDAINSAGANGGDFDTDPLSATAYVSPLHSVNWDAIATRQNSLNGILSGQPASASSAWEAFKRLGPKYPPSLEKLVMDYHHRHSKSWQLVHDLGAGSGVYSPTLARYFRQVHVSDPNPNGTSTSRQILSAWAQQNKKSRGRFTFSKETAPEMGHECVADGTVDMAIVTEGAHLADPDLLVRSAAQTLAPHGTLAFVQYSPICRIKGTPKADEAIQRLFKAWADTGAWDVACGDSAEGRKNFALGLDFVSLPEELFEQSKTRRITVNKSNNAFAIPGQRAANAADSRVHNGEKRHDYSSEGQDDVARGWRQDVGPEFFRAMTVALVGPQKAKRYEQNFKEIEKVIRETSADGINIGVEWSACVVLATRK